MSQEESDIEMDEGGDTEDDCYDDYYNTLDEADLDQADPRRSDVEYFEFECLSVEDVEKLLNESVEAVTTALQITPSLAKLLLHRHQWTLNDLIARYKHDANRVLVESFVKPGTPPDLDYQALRSSKNVMCLVCTMSYSGDNFRMLSCGHYFCNDCWAMHFEIQILQRVSTAIECMGKACNILVAEDIVLDVLTKSQLREKYQRYVFWDYVKSHPQLMICPGPNCSVVVRAKENKAKRASCSQCKTSFCFKCGCDYHAPTDCVTIKKWITKCADDSETANYISVHTKDCPKCHTCIEKNGGCNHMQCTCCKHDFCWICQGDWKNHGSEYYECSRYKDNSTGGDSGVAAAREALKKYLFYFERWENHSKSLKLEEQTLQKIKAKITSKVMTNEGTWIDWQYLLDASALLAKCRYTLQYTYPYAYFLEAGTRKALFEYQQAQLEVEIEALSFKVERAETTDRGDLENQMDIVEKRRTILLKDFQEQ